MAVWNNRPRIVRLLLNARCRLNVRDRYGDTPLMLSARRGHPEVMKVGGLSIQSTCDLFLLLLYTQAFDGKFAAGHF